MLQRGCLTLLSVTMLAMLFAGCSNGDSQMNRKPDSSQSQAPVTLQFFSIEPRDQFQRMIAEPLQKKYPYITLNYLDASSDENNLTQLVASEQAPDLVEQYHGTLRIMKDLHLQYDLTELINQNHFRLDRIEPSLIETIKAYGNAGEIYGLPADQSVVALLYNKNIFDKFATPYPTDEMTWDDVLSLAKKVTRVENGVQYYGLTSIQYNLMQQELSAHFFDEKGKAAVTTPAWVNIAKQIRAVTEIAGDAWATRPKGSNGFIKNGIVAMHPSNVSDILVNAEELSKTLNWDMVSYPTFKEAPHIGPNLTDRIYAISSTSKNKDAAFQVISYLLSDEVQDLQSRKELHRTPLVNPEIQKMFAVNNPIVKSKNLQALSKNKQAVIAENQPYDTTAKQIVTQALRNFDANSPDVNSYLRGVEDQINKEISTQNSK